TRPFTHGHHYGSMAATRTRSTPPTRHWPGVSAPACTSGQEATTAPTGTHIGPSTYGSTPPHSRHAAHAQRPKPAPRKSVYRTQHFSTQLRTLHGTSIAQRRSDSNSLGCLGCRRSRVRVPSSARGR